jgi:glycine cleavage system H protein
MAIIGGCEIPEQLYYSVEHGIWAAPDRDGDIILGIVAPRCVSLGEISFCRPRRVGTRIRLGMSCATLESAQQVAAARAPVAGVLVAVNPLVREQPLVINRDPYGCGWLVRLSADDWQRDRARLLTGRVALAAFSEQLDGPADRPRLEPVSVTDMRPSETGS